MLYPPSTAESNKANKGVYSTYGARYFVHSLMHHLNVIIEFLLVLRMFPHDSSGICFPRDKFTPHAIMNASETTILSYILYILWFPDTENGVYGESRISSMMT